MPLIVVYLIRELHRTPSFGPTLTAFGVAAVIGTFVGTGWCHVVGLGRSYLSGVFLASLAGASLFTDLTPMVLLGQAFAGMVPVRRPAAHSSPGARLAAPPRSGHRHLAHPRHRRPGRWRRYLRPPRHRLRHPPHLPDATSCMVAGLLVAAFSPGRTFRSLPDEQRAEQSMAKH